MKKAQVFVQDIVISLVIMTIIFVIYVSYYSNQNFRGENIEQDLISEAKTLTDYLTSTGYPQEWNESSVVIIGFSDIDNSISKEKLGMFTNMTKNEYEKTKFLLRTKYDYIIFFRDYYGNILNISGEKFAGKSGINDTNLELAESPGHISKISRFLVLRDGEINETAKIIEMVAYVWTKEK